MDREALNDIANRARMLTSFAREAASCLPRERESLQLTQADKGYLAAFSEHKHALSCYQDNPDEAHKLINELARLVCKYLPDFSPRYVRINPKWRLEGSATDWDAIEAELEQIERVAVAQADSQDGVKWTKETAEPVVSDYLRKHATPENPVSSRQIEREKGIPKSTVDRTPSMTADNDRKRQNQRPKAIGLATKSDAVECMGEVIQNWKAKG